MGSDGARMRVGLVGAGLVGQAVHAHFLWEERERFEFVAVADPSAAVRAAVGDRYGIPERHAGLDDLLGLGLDAIVVAVPDAFHADIACGGLEAGLHVLCEKPLALSLEECDRIAAARDTSGPRAPGRHDEALRSGRTCACSSCCPRAPGTCATSLSRCAIPATCRSSRTSR